MVLSEEVTALELITPLTWTFSQRSAHLAAPTTSALHTVTQQARNEVTQHCSHPAPRFLQPGERFWAPYFRLGSLETGFSQKTRENGLFLLTTHVAICLDSTFTLELLKHSVFFMEENHSHRWHARELPLSVTSSTVNLLLDLHLVWSPSFIQLLYAAPPSLHSSY